MVDIPIASPTIGEPERERVLDVLDSGYLAAGDVVEEFEAEFADYCEADRGVAATNGTAALHAALEAVGVSEGANVITTPFSFVATANTIQFAGGTPVFADIDPETYNLDPESVEEKIRESDEPVDAIVAVHLYGLPAEMDALRDIADDYDVALVEDAAQAHGARYDGEAVGAIGDVGCFSFYPTKNMTSGEGGMITTDRQDVADAAERFINHGREVSGYDHVEVGHNFRMTNMEAAVGLAQLERLPEFNRKRRENARKLTERLADTEVETPAEPENRRHVYHQYTVRCPDREGLKETLADHGVGSAVYYPTPIHELGAYEEYSVSAPVSERAADEALSLPVHPEVDDDDIEQITAAITETPLL
ncbi:DegT/DnrJ/EryC1/StrS family aminotransferase [Haloarcula nitratireducens]|uniref:DegT/DnrJ/EryC1/StrS family aminotransferase n=1 Tax=Haloarcula nitratireducens TaxID=2487749 RepID=A0AAW4PDP0_9EURY|nr:DegT/DnrJ/EryC1/StrS family aminotransferase [Halomicroarcula nitratireducens]MBX0295766.1 DegT/DnrJ/EryC1/StrS family aminotransferase [Halomicroarcula nitratireducens]